MNRSQIKRMHIKQDRILKQTMQTVKSKQYVCNGDDEQKLRIKLALLRFLKRQLKRAFKFNDYQAEFVKNEAMKRVLKHSPEAILVSRDPKKAQKLVRASFVLGHHYFRFIMTML